MAQKGKNTTKKTTAKKTVSRMSKTGASNRASSVRQSYTADTGIRRDIILLAVLAFAVLLFISLFGIGGVVGNLIRQLIFGVFGLPGYVFPLLIFFGFAFYVANEDNYLIGRKMTGIALFFIFSCPLWELIFNGYTKGIPFKTFFTESAEFHTGGGLIGGLFVSLFGLAFGIVGAYILTLVILMIAAIVMTQKPLLTRARQKGSAAAQSARAQSLRRKAEREQRRIEYEALLAEEDEDDEITPFMADTLVTPAPQKDEKNTKTRNSAKAKNGTGTKKTSLTAGINPIERLRRSGKSKQEDIRVPDAEYMYPEDGAEDNFVMPEMSETTQNKAQNKAQGEPDHFIHDPAVLSESLRESLRKNMHRDDAPVEEVPFVEDDVTDVEPVENNKMVPEETASRRKVRPHSTEEEIREDVDAIKNEMAVEEAEEVKERPYVLPSTELLSRGKGGRGESESHLEETARKLQETFHDFGVNVRVTDISCGPTVTRYEMQPEHGVKVSRILSLQDDIKLALAATDIRIEAPIPGKAAVGIEVPNKETSTVMLREMLESKEFKEFNKPLAFAVGKDIGGRQIVTDIAKMPHLLIAGATGSGKSVCINTLIMSILYKSSPKEVRMLMIDPKVVELKIYDGIPHLLIPVVTDVKKASGALNWAVAEMTDRYNKFAEMPGVRDIDSYNQRVRQINEDPSISENPEYEGKLKEMPRIVVIVDELADLMMVAPGEVEDAICRLAQLARAAGIHVIIATQRPSVNVVTGLIKANMPSRIALSVTSGVDSRTILDMNGAEKLLGKGDMLFYPQGYATPLRVQGGYVSDEEISNVVKFLSDQQGVVYNNEVEQKITESLNHSTAAKGGDGDGNGKDELFWDAGKLIIDKDKASIGMLQRMFRIGFNRAARIMDQLCDAGVVGPEEGTKPRTILMSEEQFDNMRESGDY